MLGENLRLGEADGSWFSLSSRKEEKEPGFDRQSVIRLISIAYWNEDHFGGSSFMLECLVPLRRRNCNGIGVQCHRSRPGQQSAFHCCAGRHGNGGQSQDVSLEDRGRSQSRRTS